MVDKDQKNAVSIGKGEQEQIQLLRKAHAPGSERVALRCEDLTECEVREISETKMASEHEELNEELDDQNS